VNADLECREGYSIVLPYDQDPNLILDDIDLDLTGARWLRLAAAMRYTSPSEPLIGEWFWTGEDGGWSADRSARFFLGTDEPWRVYWTYIKATGIGRHIDNLRFDSVNDRVEADIRWIAATPIRP
jgi:hypothetical protein